MMLAPSGPAQREGPGLETPELHTNHFEDLPETVVMRIVTVLCRGSNVGDVMRHALTCRRLHSVVGAAESFWRARCDEIGWSQRRATPDNHERTQEGGWFSFYCACMQRRYKLRRFLKLYIPFLPRASQINIEPGTWIFINEYVCGRLRARAACPASVLPH